MTWLLCIRCAAGCEHHLNFVISIYNQGAGRPAPHCSYQIRRDNLKTNEPGSVLAHLAFLALALSRQSCLSLLNGSKGTALASMMFYLFYA